jgi:hypothetical protein
MRLSRKFLISSAAAAVVVFGSAGAVLAAVGTDTGDHFVPNSGAVTGKLKAGTKLVFTGSIDGAPVDVSCTTFTSGGIIPAAGLIVKLTKPPVISGCTDLGTPAIVKTNMTNGAWELKEIDVATGDTEPTTKGGDKVALVVPKLGASFSDPTLLNGCVVETAPNGPASITGTFNDSTTIIDKNAPVPVKATGTCTTASAAATATVVLSRSVHDS